MYQKKDFEKCVFNPCVDNIFEFYPQLDKIKSVNPVEITDLVMKYIICVYDYKSPIAVSNRDLKIRKQVAAEFVGFDYANENLSPIYNLSSKFILKAVDTFLKSYIHSRVWYMICCNENIFWEYGQRMLMPVGVGVGENGKEGINKKMSEKDMLATMQAKTKLSEDMAAIDERLDAAYKRLYGDENLDKFISGGVSPERIAQERANVFKAN